MKKKPMNPTIKPCAMFYRAKNILTLLKIFLLYTGKDRAIHPTFSSWAFFILNRVTPISSAFLLAIRATLRKTSREHFAQYLRGWDFLYWFLGKSLGAGEGQCVSDVIITILTFLSYQCGFHVFATNSNTFSVVSHYAHQETDKGTDLILSWCT